MAETNSASQYLTQLAWDGYRTSKFTKPKCDRKSNEVMVITSDFAV